jgi:hypothetical protein
VVLIGGGVFAFIHFAPPSWRHQAAALASIFRDPVVVA